LQEVLALSRRIGLEINQRFIGRTVEVLIEGRNRNGDPYGRTDDHRTVVLPGATVEAGEFAVVRITRATSAGLHGEPAVPLEVKGEG